MCDQNGLIQTTKIKPHKWIAIITIDINAEKRQHFLRLNMAISKARADSKKYSLGDTLRAQFYSSQVM